MVTVRVPQAIPGAAEVEVRDQTGTVTGVELLTLHLVGSGSEFAPRPQIAERSKQDPQSFVGSLWLMESGAMQIRVLVSGSKGTGELAIPVPATALQKLPMSKPLAAGLFGLLLLLVLGGLSIVAEGARTAELAPGRKSLTGGPAPGAKRHGSCGNRNLLLPVFRKPLVERGRCRCCCAIVQNASCRGDT